MAIDVQYSPSFMAGAESAAALERQRRQAEAELERQVRADRAHAERLDQQAAHADRLARLQNVLGMEATSASQLGAEAVEGRKSARERAGETEALGTLKDTLAGTKPTPRMALPAEGLRPGETNDEPGERAPSLGAMLTPFRAGDNPPTHTTEDVLAAASDPRLKGYPAHLMPKPEPSATYQPISGEDEQGQYIATFNKRTGQWAKEYVGGAKPRTPGFGNELVATIDAKLAHEGLTPGTQAWADRRLDLMKQFPAGEGMNIVGAGTGATMASGPTRPVGGEVAMVVAAAAGAREAGAKIQTALKDPDVQRYLGPYAEWYSTIQRYAPAGALGDVPKSVIDLEQNVSHLQNYTIKLITGAQMSEPEAQRIMRQVVATKYRGPEFAQRLQTTLDNITAMEMRIKMLALHGNKEARAAATELGLDTAAGPPIPNTQGRPPIANPGGPTIVPGGKTDVRPGPNTHIRVIAPDGTPGWWPKDEPLTGGFRRTP